MNLKEMTLDQLGALAYDQTKVKENATRNIYLIEEQMKIKQEEIEETNDREDKIEELIARNKSLEEANRSIIADLSDKRKELSQYKQQQQTYQQSMMSREEIEEQMDSTLDLVNLILKKLNMKIEYVDEKPHLELVDDKPKKKEEK